MDLSSLIKTGVITRPQRGLTFGPKSVGKTSLLAGMPNTMIIDTEAGSHQYNCNRINVGNYQQIDTAVKTLLSERNDYQIIAIDTIDWADEYLRAEVCREKGVTDVGDFAHGRGYVLWRDKFSDFLLTLNGFIRLGKHVILVGHSQIKTVSLPGLDPYDRYELKLDKRNVETATEWADFQLFLNWDIRTIRTKDGTTRARGSNERFIYSVNDLSYDANNRLGIVEPLKLEPASLSKFLAASPVVPAESPVVPPAQGPVTTTAGKPAPIVDPVIEPPAPSTDGPEPEPEPATELSVQEQLKEALYGLPEDWVTGFLVNRKKIAAGQTILDASATYCKSALKRLTEFRTAINKFGEETEDVSVNPD